MNLDLSKRVSIAMWIYYWKLRSRYHRYETAGFDHLRQDRSCLVVGYHGRPTALDLCMLSVTIHDKMGYLPHGIVHETFDRVPILGTMFQNLGFVTGDGPGIEHAIHRREHIVTAPGGTREAYRHYRTRYRVNWGNHLGYLKLAVKYRLPIIPVAASGVDDVFIGLNNGYQLGKQLHIPMKIPFWLAMGATGLWPLTLPFPEKIRQIIGRPIDPASLGLKDPEDHEKIRALHNRVMSAVQGLLNKARKEGRHADRDT